MRAKGGQGQNETGLDLDGKKGRERETGKKMTGVKRERRVGRTGQGRGRERKGGEKSQGRARKTQCSVPNLH